MGIIDVRCRLTIPEVGAYFRNVVKQFGKTVEMPSTIEEFFDVIGEGGITTAVSVLGNNPGFKTGRWNMPDRTSSNEILAELQKKHWGRLISVGGIDAGNTFHNALEEIDKCHRLGLRAIFMEPGRSPGCNLDDRRLYPLYERCLANDMALIPQTSGIVGGKSIDFANPVHLDQVAQDFPELRILAGHACYPFYREAIAVSARHEHVYLSPDMYLFHMGRDDWVNEVNANHFGLQDRYLYGTAYPSGAQPKPYAEAFFKLPWEPEALPKILYKNALRFFKLEDDPTFAAMYADSNQPVAWRSSTTTPQTS